MTNHPKLKLKISPTCVDCETLDEIVRSKYDIVYCGIHSMNDDYYLYLHNRERMYSSILKKILDSVLEIIDVSKFSAFEGEVMDSKGSGLKHGGSRKHKKRIRGRPQKRSRTPPQPAPASVLQPSTPPKKARANNAIIIHEDVYVGRTFGALSLDMSHAIWSSVDGLWSPVMWVGPLRDIAASKRVSLGPRDVTKLYKSQRNRCKLCRTEVFTGTHSNSDVDHIVPLMYGGTSSLGNLQVLCVTCHRRKTTLECRKVVTLTGGSEKKANNPILIHENAYVGRTVGTPSPEMFHAIWSCVNGTWSPMMWVGPTRNIVVSKRVSPKPCDVTTLYKDQDNKCKLCRTDVFTGTYSNSDVDHIVPLMYGGTSSLSNLQVLCVTCHRRKTALECKKVMTSIGESGVDWGSKVYLSNSHVHHLDKPGSVRGSTPREFLDTFGSRAGLCVLNVS